MNLSLSERLGVLKESLLAHVKQTAPESPCRLVLSVSDNQQRAQVLLFQAPVFDEAFASLSEHCLNTESLESLTFHLKVDVVQFVEASSWGALRARLQQTKRNYFTRGIALDSTLNHFFLHEELNANAMLYPGGSVDHGIVNENNFSKYGRQKFGGAWQAPRFADADPVFLFDTLGFYCGENGQVHLLETQGAAAGRRQLPPLTASLCETLIQQSSEFLARQVQDDGLFVYGLFPCFNNRIPGYNTLRHASTTYAMLEAWELTRNKLLGEAIERSLATLTTRLIRPITLPNNARAAALVDTGDEIKLGGNAVSILALAKYTELTSDARYLPLMEQLANTIIAMMDPPTRQFSHVLNYPDLSLKERFRIIYYDGEAAFALMRLYGITRNPRWLKAVELAFEHFIAARHWQAHDHWLSYCVNALTHEKPARHYFEFGVNNVAGYLDFVMDRVTTFPTLLELMMAAQQMLGRLKSTPGCEDLLQRIDEDKFYRALHHRANYLLNGFFWPEWAMYFKVPESVSGSFFIRHHSFRVRIDDIEHYLSGLIAYRKFLLQQDAKSSSEQPETPQTLQPVDKPTNWHQQALAAVTGGYWAVAPHAAWVPSGLCTWLGSYRPSDLLVLQQYEGEAGEHPHNFAQLQAPVQAVMATRVPDNLPPECGVLLVNHNADAVMKLARHARTQFRGKVIGVTGSAGKTTLVGMLGHLLGQHGKVETTRGNANLPLGVAWNLASMNWQADYVALEMAIGRMRISTQIARPDVAVISNIGAAHLEYHHTVENIALRKARMFESMAPGSIAVLNRDTQCYLLLEARAIHHGLRVLTFGRHPESAVRLVGPVAADGTVHFRLNGTDYSAKLPAWPQHLVMNLMACMAVGQALGLDVDKLLQAAPSFSALPGRGQVLNAVVAGTPVQLIDDSYNANPLSMQAALQTAVAHGRNGRRVHVVLGDMLELADQAQALHKELVPAINPAFLKTAVLLGTHMASLAPAFNHAHGFAFPVEQLDNIEAVLGPRLQPGDLLMLKGSNGTGLHKLVAQWAESPSNSGS